MSGWISSHVQACLRAFKRMLLAPMATLISTLVIGIAIMLPLGLYSLFSNITTAASRLNTEPNVNVYLQVAAKDEDAREIEKRLQATTNVANVKFISREAALTEMKRVASVADLLGGLDSNPLRPTLSCSSKCAKTLQHCRKWMRW
jgi:cell division transport system permease protein